ncbi:ribonucleases P/MRP protein subunit POP1 isoform X2 [Homalodisca vitripennis]|nr:ribonucleases P/MRP protein subunit POP1 isoform X2 [Homalodisca vitripennis]
MPKHLRRRAMSHNVKRMPRRLREVHLNQLEKSGLPIKGKRPSRKFRRRPSNLLQEYNRRAAAATWLETHIWHAKRFHMVKRWGYQLPQAPTNKGYRACYRASAKHCLLQDVSYLNCIELQGPEAKILRGLNQLTSPECGLTFAAKCTLDGMREGSVTLFRCGGYPSQAIGKVTFLWRPERDNSVRTIWIWSHPAFYHELLQELITVFQLKLEESNEMNVDANESEISESTSLLKVKRNVEKEKLTIRNDRKLPRYSNDTIVMVLMKNSLNRFRLTGPLAQVVLTEALKFVIVDDFVKPDTNTETMDVDDAEQPRSLWLCDFYKYDTRLQTLRKQCSFWENVLRNVNSASELSPGMVLSAVVMDPRLTMPSTRTKAVNSGVTNLQQEVLKSLSSHSPLWEFELRERVNDSKMSTSQLNGLRSRALVPGLASAAWLGSHNVSHLPILLVQNRGQYEQSGYGSGWDVIVPAGWGIPVWLGLVYRGARVGGLRETERLTLETVSGPTLPPDTEAGCLDSEQARSENYEKHFRLPPDKRPNYIKLGVIAPFHCPWERLLQDWHSEGDGQGIYVIRNRGQLDFLKCLLSRTKPVTTCVFSEKDKACGLVQVGIEMCGRGTLERCALICGMGKKDIRLTKDKTGKGPFEPIHEDENEEKRKIQREEHQLKLLRLRRKRVKAKREMEEKGIFSVKTKEKKNPTEKLVQEQAELMKELWLPNEIKSVKNSSSRPVLGFVTFGGYSFRQSKTCGYGFVALSALLSVLERNQGYFLVRNVTSLQYYFVRLKLLLPV